MSKPYKKVTRSQFVFAVEELISCDGVLDHSYGGHNSLPTSYEGIAEWIVKGLENKGMVEFLPEGVSQ